MLSRRRALQAIGAAAGAMALPAAACADPLTAASSPAIIPFHGDRQAGIATPPQDRIVFAAFDVGVDRVADLRDLLRAWSEAAAAMTAGRSLDAGEAEPLSPPNDTGETAGLDAARLTLTLGLGAPLFTRLPPLAAARPAALIDLPALPGDALDAARAGGDLCVQACADDPQVAFHAVRNLARLGRGAAAMRWSQLGFARSAAPASGGQPTPRNLMGFRDGTRNVRGDDGAAMRTHVWAGGEAPPWMRGGTYLVARRIRMRIESWDRTSLREQERTIGRHKASGAPLGGAGEFDRPDLARTGAGGEPVIAGDAHIRLAAPESNGGVRLLRRGYGYTDGIDPATGELDAGLFFVAFQRDPRTGFIALQRRLGAEDALSEYIRHTGGGLFACPPGVRPGGFWADRLLGA